MSVQLSRIKRIINLGLERVGQRVDSSSVIPSFERFSKAVRAAGLKPKTVFDIGVATGTPWLYDAFPQAKYFLIDPTPQSVPFMKTISNRLDAEILNVGLGNVEGSAIINVRHEHAGSSMLEEVGNVEILQSIEVPVHRFDRMIGKFDRPALVKIDVQGAEKMVIDGMGPRISELDVIIVETSLIATLKGGPEFAEIVLMMKERGWVLFDITGVSRRPLDKALTQIDAVFVPENSPLRADRRWAS